MFRMAQPQHAAPLRDDVAGRLNWESELIGSVINRASVLRYRFSPPEKTRLILALRKGLFFIPSGNVRSRTFLYPNDAQEAGCVTIAAVAAYLEKQT